MVMTALRTIKPARLASLRAPVSMATRSYSPDTRPEGATGSSKGFSQREQAEEGQYIRKREQEQLQKAQEKLKAAQAEVDAQQKKVDAAK